MKECSLIALFISMFLVGIGVGMSLYNKFYMYHLKQRMDAMLHNEIVKILVEERMKNEHEG